jgi:hypothetical protein
MLQEPTTTNEEPSLISDLRSPTPAPTDDGWDAFLQSVPGGEFYQSRAFARLKEMDGWRVARIVLQEDGVVQAGFQLTFRRTRFGPIGYVSRGPVLRGPTAALIDTVIDALLEQARKLHLRALLVHPPASGPPLDALLRQRGFLANRLQRIITATLVVDVAAGPDSTRARMNRTTRREIRQAASRGVTVREGTMDEVGLFYELMLETCRRQGTAPNPARADMLAGLWRGLPAPALGRLTFADCDGKTVAGLFCIGFNRRLSIWKKGSLPEYLERRPVHLLYDEAFQWAAANHYRVCDFCGLQRAIADGILSGEPMPPELLKSRDMLNLGFGGRPELLAEPLVHFPNRILRHCYRCFLVNPLGARVMKRYYSC